MMTAAVASPRNLAITSGVVALHLVALWWVQAGLVASMPEKVVEIDMLSQMIEPPKALPMAALPAPVLPARIAPAVPPPKSTAPAATAPRPTSQPAAPPRTPTLPPVANAATTANAPVVDAVPPSPAATPAASALSPPALLSAPSVPAPAASPAPPKVELPSTDATYLNNPKPAYPAISRRLGEQGKVLLRVVIAADGSAQKVELQKSSGYERLDQAAVNAVQQWRFVPGKRNGFAETMTHTVPINFSLE